MEKKELAEAIKAEFLKLFPKSGVYVSKACMGDDYAITILLGNKSTHPNNIEQNDILRGIYWVSEEKGAIVVTCNGAGLSGIKPKEGSFMYCETVKVPFRKKTGDENKIITGMAKHFEAVRKCVDENKVNLLPQYQTIYADF